MNLIAAAAAAVERMDLPDSVTRAAISALVARTSRRLGHADPAFEQRFASGMAAYPAAVRPEAANAQPPPACSGRARARNGASATIA